MPYQTYSPPAALSNLLGWTPYRLTENPNTKKLEKKPTEKGFQHSQDSFDSCLKKIERNSDLLPGIVLNQNVNNLVLVDFDNVKDDLDLTKEADEYVKSLDTFTEISASGKGIHCLTISDVEKNYKHKYKLRSGEAEVYWDKRLVALTFNPFFETLRNPAKRFDLESYLPFLQEKTDGGIFRSNNIETYKIHDKCFEDLICRLSTQKNRKKFLRLFHGHYFEKNEWAGSDEYPTQSEADLALVSIIKWYSSSKVFLKQHFEELDNYDLRSLSFCIVDKCFKHSKLYRDKWRTRFDYRLRTFEIANPSSTFEGFTDYYNPEKYYDKNKRAQQKKSSVKRRSNNYSKIKVAIKTLRKKRVKVTYRAISNITGISYKSVSIILRNNNHSI